MRENDYIFYKKNNQLYSGGYKLKNLFTNHRVPVLNNAGVPSLLFPSALYYNSQSGGGNESYVYAGIPNDDRAIENSLYEKLLNRFLKTKKTRSRKKHRYKRKRKSRKKY